MKKYPLDSESVALWLDVFWNKRKLCASPSKWSVYLQPSLFVNGEVGIVFDSAESHWIVRATAAAGKKIENDLKNQTVEDVLSAIK